MPRHAHVVRPTATAVACALAAALLAGCGGEPQVIDGSSNSAEVAGAKELLADTRVTVIDAANPPTAVIAEVNDAAEAAGVSLERLDVDDPLLADGLDDVGGLAAVLAHQGDAQGPVVVLIFGGPTAAVQFAASDAAVFASAQADEQTRGFLAGNVLTYSGSGRAVALARDMAAGLTTPGS